MYFRGNRQLATYMFEQQLLNAGYRRENSDGYMAPSYYIDAIYEGIYFSVRVVLCETVIAYFAYHDSKTTRVYSQTVMYDNVDSVSSPEYLLLKRIQFAMPNNIKAINIL